MLTETRVAKLRLFILISLFLLLLMSHLRGQLVFPLRGVFIAAGLGLISIVIVLLHWRDLQLAKLDVWVLVSYFGFTLWAVIKTFSAPVPAEAYSQLGTYIEGGLLLISVLILFRQVRQSEHWCFAFILLVLVVSLMKAIAQYFWEFSVQLTEFATVVATYPSRIRDGILFALQEGRVFAYYGNPNVFCGFLAMCFPATLWLLRFKPAIQRRYSTLAIRLVSLIIILLVVVIAFLTGSRGGMLALIVGGAMYYYLAGSRPRRGNYRKIGLIGAGVLGGVVLIICLLMFYTSRQEGGLRSQIGRWTNLSTLNQRYYYLEAAAKMISRAPLQGNGLSSYGILYPQVKREEALESRYAHNFLAQLWAELGIVGAGLFLWFCYLMGKKFQLVWKQSEAQEKSSLAVFMAGGIAFLFSSLLDWTFYYREFYLDFMLWCGAVVAFVPDRQKEMLRGEVKVAKIFLVTILLVSLVINIKVIFAHQLAKHFHQVGLDYLRENRIEEGLRNLARAIRIEPENPQFQMDYGGILLARGDATGGIRRLEEAARLNPYSASVNSQLAQSLAELGFIEGALEYAEKAVTLYPSNADYQAQLGELYIKAGEKVRAIKALETALKLARIETDKEKYRRLLQEVRESNLKNNSE